MDAPKIVVEKISPSHRRFHVDTTFSCELEHGIVHEQLDEMIRNMQPGSLTEVTDALERFFEKHSPECSLETALSTVEYCDHSHSETGIIDVTINLARADWSIIQKRIIGLIKTNLAWKDSVELVTV